MKFNNILIIEQENIENMFPFSILHCSWEIRCGCLKIYEKYEYLFPGAKIRYIGRENHLKSFKKRYNFDNSINFKPEENLLIFNSNILINKELIDEIEQITLNKNNKEKIIFKTNGQMVSVFVQNSSSLNNFNLKSEDFIDIDYIELKSIKFINYIWDAIEFNDEAIKDDLLLLKTNLKQINNTNFLGINTIYPENIYIGENVKIYPGTVIVAEDGPVIISDNVKILPNSTIFGACYIGNNSVIKTGAKIYEKTSIGDFCKIGGEIENSIIQDYSNKQHEGFLGHSFISEWVNLGADTNTSDLKNTYGNISVLLQDKEIDTGRMFLGLLCGDHTKSAINTSFTTGTVAGIAGVLVVDGFLPRYIRSFAWGGKKDSTIYKASKAIEVAKTVMARRNKTLLPEEEFLIIEEFEEYRNKMYNLL